MFDRDHTDVVTGSATRFEGLRPISPQDVRGGVAAVNTLHPDEGQNPISFLNGLRIEPISIFKPASVMIPGHSDTDIVRVSSGSERNIEALASWLEYVRQRPGGPEKSEDVGNVISISVHNESLVPTAISEAAIRRREQPPQAISDSLFTDVYSNPQRRPDDELVSRTLHPSSGVSLPGLGSENSPVLEIFLRRGALNFRISGEGERSDTERVEIYPDKRSNPRPDLGFGEPN